MADRSDKTLTDSVHAFSESCRRERRFDPASQAGFEAVLRSFLNFLKTMGFHPDRSTPGEVTPDTVRGYLAHLFEERGGAR